MKPISKYSEIMIADNLFQETKVEIGESVRGKDVFIIQTGSK